MSLRRKRQLIPLCYHAGVVGIGLAGIWLGMHIGNGTLLKFSSLLLAIHLLTFRAIPISRWIAEALIREVACYGCGLEIELTGVHLCGCGFVSHKERHAFSPCPMCGKSYLWINCPQCETSIPI